LDNISEWIEHARHTTSLSGYYKTLIVVGSGAGLLPLDNREGVSQDYDPRKEVHPRVFVCNL